MNNIIDLSLFSEFLNYQSVEGNDYLHFNNVNLQEIIKQYPTPFFIYSADHIAQQLSVYQKGLEGRKNAIFFAVKANPNIHLLSYLNQLGSNFDVVSIGEFQRVLTAGAKGGQIVFSGIGKSVKEIIFALQNQVSCINVESEAELLRINEIAKQLEIIAPISIRVNPNIDAKTHPYISTGLENNKFGIAINQVTKLYLWTKKQPHLKIKGIACHIGSQLLDLDPLCEATKEIVSLVKELKQKNISIEYIDIGGGLGITYENNQPFNQSQLSSFFSQITSLIPKHYTIHVEPGRFIVGNAGLLITKVEYFKQQNKHNFVIVDAAMNDIMRPALYQAIHEIVPLRLGSTQEKLVDVVGPICESSDCLAKNRNLSVEQGDYLAVLSAGAYCSSMNSNYNSRPKIAEILLKKQELSLIRKKETFEQMICCEK